MILDGKCSLMRVLVTTKIFPSSLQPDLAPYNRLQFGELARHCDLTMWALAPWLPGRQFFAGAASAALPREEVIDQLRVQRPRVLYAPGVGRPLSGPLVAASLVPRALPLRGQIDVVLGSFAYPDGWAAVALSRVLNVPAVIKVHGSDVNVHAEDPLLRSSVRWAFRRAAAVVGPSQALIDKSVALGANPETSRMIPNGVEKHAFRIRERAPCRMALGHAEDRKRWILFVGRLEEAKGIKELLPAFKMVCDSHDDVRLVLVGSGVDTDWCRAFAKDNQLPVLFAGMRRPVEVPLWIGASDLVTLPSWREGTPNVIIEALACGRRVVASDVGGIPAVLCDPLLGEVVPARHIEPLAAALSHAIEAPGTPEAIAQRAAAIGWDESGALLYDVLRRAVDE